MKKHLRHTILLLILFFIVFCFIKINLYSSPKVLIKEDPKIFVFTPVRLVIPIINVNANIQSMGINPLGEMDVPPDITEVGLYKYGAIPGQTGVAVISGHYNGKNNQEGVFFNLEKLKVGDKLSIIDKEGKAITFVVTKKELYDSGYADNVFNQADGIHLNLITCDGLWDETKKSYTKRLVIFSDLLKE